MNVELLRSLCQRDDYLKEKAEQNSVNVKWLNIIKDIPDTNVSDIPIWSRKDRYLDIILNTMQNI